MGEYEDQPGHVEVVEQTPPPVETYPNGGAAVPGMEPEGTQAADEPVNTAVADEPVSDDDDDDDD